MENRKPFTMRTANLNHLMATEIDVIVAYDHLLSSALKLDIMPNERYKQWKELVKARLPEYEATLFIKFADDFRKMER